MFSNDFRLEKTSLDFQREKSSKGDSDVVDKVVRLNIGDILEMIVTDSRC